LFFKEYFSVYIILPYKIVILSGKPNDKNQQKRKPGDGFPFFVIFD